MLKKLLILLFILVLLASCGDEDDGDQNDNDQAADPTAELTGTIVLADVADDPAEVINLTQPLADYLAANLGEFGIGKGEVKIAPDFDTMIEWIRTGEVDLYFDSLYPAMVITTETGAQTILRRSRFGVSEYHSVFFVLKDSEFESLDDLQGKLVAFDRPISTTGYMIPLAHLIQNGYMPVEVPDTDSTVDENEIGYVFSGFDDNTIQWVLSGLVAAGVTDSGSYERLPQETRDLFMILAETEDVPRQVVIVRPGMDAALLAAVIEVLVGADETDAGKVALQAFEQSAFDEFPEGIEAALSRMQELYNLALEYANRAERRFGG